MTEIEARHLIALLGRALKLERLPQTVRDLQTGERWNYSGSFSTASFDLWEDSKIHVWGDRNSAEILAYVAPSSDKLRLKLSGQMVTEAEDETHRQRYYQVDADSSIVTIKGNTGTFQFQID